MKTEEILEGNKLIAEFMYPNKDKRRKDYPLPYPVIEVVPAEKLMGYGSCPEGEIKHYTGTPDMMEYHSSWDWLMPVVRKFNTQEFDDWKDFGDLAAALVAVSIEDVFNIVLNGIKWYNKTKQEVMEQKYSKQDMKDAFDAGDKYRLYLDKNAMGIANKGIPNNDIVVETMSFEPWFNKIFCLKTNNN